MKIFTRIFLLFVASCAYAQYPCPNDNVGFGVGNAPTVLGDSISTPCLYGGEYIIVNGMSAGSIYRVATCYNSFFDTQITIYNSSGTAVAYNDDWCGIYSEIYFSPPATGNYRILVDEYPCSSNSLCAHVSVTLLYTPRPVIEIPVVVHVVYNTPQQNISDAQIQSQIDVLNQDFRRLNANQQNTPAVFRGRAMNPLIQFCLAERTPDGKPTNGITRTYTNKTEFAFIDTSIYMSSAGGHDNWNKDDYLNIWVCNIVDSWGGWALFPSITTSIPQADGVVMNFEIFGTIGTAIPSYNAGHMCSHEVGHWLNLRHIWGDDQMSTDVCLGSDSINDTPNHEVSNIDTYPTFPHITSCSGPEGEMYMNFMDYTDDDDTLNMFTVGQFVRMDDALFNYRLDLWSSLGCVPCSTVSQFTASSSSPCIGDTVTFTNQSTSGSFTWFVDGAIHSTTTNISGFFSTPGQHQIALAVLNNGCKDTSYLTVNVSNIVVPTISISSNAGTTICSGQSVTFSATTTNGGNSPAYQWKINSSNVGTNSASFTTTSLNDGDVVSCVLTSIANCATPATVTSNGISMTVNSAPSAPIVSVSPSNNICQGESATLAVSNPCSGCTYLWTPGNLSGSSIMVNTAGAYSVVATNTCGSVSSNTVSITVTPLPTTPTININPSSVICQGSSTTLSVSNPCSGCTYLWTPGNITGNSIQVTTVGNYSVEATNSCGNISSLPANIVVNALPVTPIIAASPSSNICPGSTATLSISNFCSGCNYTWSSGQTGTSIQISSSATYTVTVADNNNCTNSSSIVIGNSTVTISINITSQTSNTSCATPNGTATVSASGGATPYVYSWSNGATGTSINNVAGGNYTVTATDANGCLGSQTVNINNSIPTITASILSSGGNNSCATPSGFAVVSASGGVMPYSFQWSSGHTSTSVNNLLHGNYTVTVSDDNGCSATVNVSIADNRPILAITIITNPVTSCTSPNGSATASVAGTSGSVTYTWGTSPAQTGATASGLAAGAYTVTALDQTSGCTVSETATIGSSLLSVSVSITSTNDLTNCGTPNGSATAVASGSSGFTYLWSTVPAQTGNTATGLIQGNYTVIATDQHGCTGVATATINDSRAVITVTVNATSNTLCTGANGTASASSSGGSQPYLYSWNNGATTANLSNLASGNYSVTSTDANECTGTATVTVGTNITMPTVTISVTNETSASANDGAATANPSAGTPPFQYSWSTSGTTQTVSSLDAGTYSVTITDQSGCTASASAVVETEIGVNIADLNEIYQLTIFPNPNSGSFVVNIETKSEKQIQISVFNVVGQKVYDSQAESITGDYSKPIKLKNAVEGIYFVRIAIENSIVNRKIIIR